MGLPRRRDPPGFGGHRHVRHRAVGRARAHRPGRSDAARTPTGVTFRAKGYAPNREDQVGGLHRRAERARARWHRGGARARPRGARRSPSRLRSRPRQRRRRERASGSSSRRSRPATRRPTSTSSRRTASRTPPWASLADGPNSAGQNIIRLTNEDGRGRSALRLRAPVGHLSRMPRASRPASSTTPRRARRARALPQFPNPYIVERDTQIVIDATDADRPLPRPGHARRSSTRRRAGSRSST